MMLFILQGGSAPFYSNMLMMLVIFFIMYYFFLRPQMKKQKEQMAFQNAIKKGDEVVTTSGMIGQVSKIDDQEVVIAVDGKTFIRFTRSAISKEMTDAYNKNKKTEV